MSDTLPEGWVELPFGELLTELRNGISTRPNLDPPGTAILRISAVREGTVLLDDHRFLPESGSLVGTFALKNRDLLFTRYNGSLDLLGICGMVRGLDRAVLLYPDKLIRVRVDEQVTCPEYVELYFRSPRAREAITSLAKSSAGQQGISGANLKQQVLRLSPFAEQRRIVQAVEALLRRVTAARDRLTKVPAILKAVRQSVFAAACLGRLTEDWRASSRPIAPCLGAKALTDDVPDLPQLPEGWTTVPMSAVVDRFQYGTSDKADGDERTGVPLLRMGNIQEGRLELNDLKFIRRSRNLGAFLVHPGDVLFNRTNSPELVGKTAVVDFEQSMAFASYLIRIKVNPKLARPLFVSWWLNSPWGRQWARQVRTDGVSQSNINASKLAAMPLPLPSLVEQDEILRIGKQLLTVTEGVEARLETAMETAGKVTHAILAKAFAGELVPTEAELARDKGRSYEPASALLERVRQRAAQLAPKGRPAPRPERRRRA